MCGIFTLLNSQIHNDHKKYNNSNIQKQFSKGKERGPEYSTLTRVSIEAFFGFHRLAINGLNNISNQPIIYNDITLICNGEIYNYKELYSQLGITPTTQSDCEVIIHLYERYGIDHTLQMLDGVFAFVLLDKRDHSLDFAPLYVARDPYGVRPLFQYTDRSSSIINVYGFASEIKMLYNFYKGSLQSKTQSLSQFPPGHYSKFVLPNKVLAQWKWVNTVRYHTTGFVNSSNITTGNTSTILSNPRFDMPTIYKNIQYDLVSAVYKRCSTTDRPIACLLSGGLDSSLITAIVQEYHNIHKLRPVETYSIGIYGSEDLKYAKQVAEYLGTNHTEIILSEQDFIDAVPHVIRAIESYDTTSVRASIGNWFLGKYIKANSKAKVIFNGDGSDELCGGYLYMGLAPDPIEFDRECRRLLEHICYFDVLRSDRCISSHGLEPRTPFLDRTWVQNYLNIPVNLRFHSLNGQPEKYLLRTAFSECFFKNSMGNPILPEEIIWRKKEAFSDGVSGSHKRSLFQVLQEHAETLDITFDNIKDNSEHNLPKTAEQKWYRYLFEKSYSGLSPVIPYFWMPKYIDANDASARTLSIYANK